MAAPPSPPQPPFLIRILRTVLRALLLAFVVGFAIGTWIRCAAEQASPRTLPYLGGRTSELESDRPA